MQNPIYLQKDYTSCNHYYQIKLPFEMEKIIPADDSVRLLSAFVEGMDLSELYATYDSVSNGTVLIDTLFAPCVIRIISLGFPVCHLEPSQPTHGMKAASANKVIIRWAFSYCHQMISVYKKSSTNTSAEQN